MLDLLLRSSIYISNDVFLVFLVKSYWGNNTFKKIYGVHLEPITKIINKINCTHWESCISTTSWGLEEELRNKACERLAPSCLVYHDLRSDSQLRKTNLQTFNHKASFLSISFFWFTSFLKYKPQFSIS